MFAKTAGTSDGYIQGLHGEQKIDVKSMNIRTSKKGTATMEMGFVVHGKEEIEPCDRETENRLKV